MQSGTLLIVLYFWIKIIAWGKEEILIEFKKQLYSVNINQSLNKKARDKASKLHKNVEKNFKFKEVVAFFDQMDEKVKYL
ncbi:20052_t:CDS:1, partial [Racocetra fulgida]